MRQLRQGTESAEIPQRQCEPAGFRPSGLAVIPPIVVQDELAAGLLTEAAQLDVVTQTFQAVTAARRFPNPLLSEVFAPGRF